MKILVVSNLYPPHHVGGYELGCRDVVEKLRACGHLVRVLTGNLRIAETPWPPTETDVERTLQFNLGIHGLPHDKRIECEKLKAAIKLFSPEVVYFWNQDGLCRWLPFAAQRQGCRTAFFLSDTSFISWRIGAWLARLAKKNLLIAAIFKKTFLVRGRPVIENRPCHFASGFLKTVALKNGIHFDEKNSVVAHWGIELDQFASAPREHWPARRLLYCGQMIPQKGIHTAIAAFALITKEKGFEDLTFSLVGGGLQPDYEKKLRALPAGLGVTGRVNFLSKVPRAELSKIYADHDALIFPSEWDEPFAITPLEAIASGLAVVGTTTGGSGELFRNRETAMTFRAGDPTDCARAIRELLSEQALFEKIRQNAQHEVFEKHSLAAMVQKIETSLQKIADE